ncbi:amino acid permease [Oceanospirillum maris]|uniref:amino acid permease n=1 Tax=Oceanospirillum maris TaxID=64977 RepID=UPI00048407FE|nr:aromatic amino acid transport family protein [Oceanospirillum maris]
MASTRFLGSTLLVAGTALGAGMLAIPMVLAPLGLAMGLGLLFFVWAFTTLAALLLLEVNVNHHPGENMHAMSGHWLGRVGQLITNISMIFLLVFLLMAYILGASELLQAALSYIGVEVSLGFSRILFTLLAGITIVLGTGAVDRLNRFFFVVMLMTMAFALYSLATLDAEHSVHLALARVQTGDTASQIMMALPVLFTSFGFMVVIPPLVRYTGDAEGKHFSHVVIIGSLIPLICYIAWFWACMSAVDPAKLAQLSGVEQLVSTVGESEAGLGSILKWFAAMALLTSFLGVALALFGFIREMCDQKPMVNGKLPAIILTLVPSLIMASSAPGEFIKALSYAGLALTILAIFIPVAMVWRSRQQGEMAYITPGGQLTLISTLLFGFLLVGAQFY